MPRATVAFYERDVHDVARHLLGARISHSGVTIRVTEVEAYAGRGDPGSHGFRGPTPRTRVLFGPPGGLYVYFTYGMHWCANAVCGRPGQGVAVLLRAVEPMLGIDAMRAARGQPPRDRDIGSGPARLAQAFGITGAMDGADLVTGDQGLRIVDDGVPPPAEPVAGPRIGISKATEHPWRWHVPGNAHVSKAPRRPLPAAE